MGINHSRGTFMGVERSWVRRGGVGILIGGFMGIILRVCVFTPQPSLSYDFLEKRARRADLWFYMSMYSSGIERVDGILSGGWG